MSVRLSVCLYRLSTDAAACGGLLLWARRAGDIDDSDGHPAATAPTSTAVSSKCWQCHAVRRRVMLNTHSYSIAVTAGPERV